MPDDYTIAATAAEKVLNDLEQKVPGFERRMIPATLAHEVAQQVGKAVVDALNAAHAAPSSPDP